MGHVDLLLKSAAPESRWYRSADAIARSANRAARLAGQLLTISQQQTANPRRLSLNAVVQGFSDRMSQVLGEDILVTLRLSPGLGQSWPTTAR